MILFDTNILIYAFSPASPFHVWSREILVNAAAKSEAVINPIILAELCVGDSDPKTVADRVRSWGVINVDLPASAACACAEAFKAYLIRREDVGRKPITKIPLPDFFIGSHAEMMGWRIATADIGRYQTYFPKVLLMTP
ncbi:MAG: type II toxin-antitoxin system VapC family toxin [Verrucomicrobia bacterium]|nr:type II toxin-antitoxin system VapC family toxin [Verrucomicrobiota bacterium]MDA1068190.1 type II toxin-antitoxin system VapC family toxin [Verrucomicrobiota bacterium]